MLRLCPKISRPQLGEAWDDTIRLGTEHGFRNAQASVLAPTGTIGFMMDCDTTGIEPDIALIKYKRLVGGGTIKIVNNTVDEALQHLGYDEAQRKAIADYVDREETIEGAPGLDCDHLPVFDCAFRAANGTRSISCHGSHPHDGGCPTLHLGRHFQDGEPACGCRPWRNSRRHTWRHGRRAEGHRLVPRGLQTVPSRSPPARPIRVRSRRRHSSQGRPASSGASCPMRGDR